MNILQHNSAAWDAEVEAGNEWSQPVSREIIEAARRGEWSVVLTPLKAVPRDWFPARLRGARVLCLASGGGQQAPVFAAAGADVTSFDNSARQLAQDKFVADRDNLIVRLEQGDAADLSRFREGEFDLIFHPVSNVFMPDLAPVWRESFRILSAGGALLAGFMNPLFFIFDKRAEQRGQLKVKHTLPYSDLESQSKRELARQIKENAPLEFGHTLTAQIGGQIAAGFSIRGFYEDSWTNEASPLNRFTPLFIATRAVK